MRRLSSNRTLLIILWTKNHMTWCFSIPKMGETKSNCVVFWNWSYYRICITIELKNYNFSKKRRKKNDPFYLKLFLLTIPSIRHAWCQTHSWNCRISLIINPSGFVRNLKLLFFRFTFWWSWFEKHWLKHNGEPYPNSIPS